MKTSWLNGLDQKAQQELKADYISAKYVRARLTKLLEDKIKESYNSAIAKVTYESPSWALYQADNVGFERALKEVISLIADTE
jgi:hypothetical protein